MNENMNHHKSFDINYNQNILSPLKAKHFIHNISSKLEKIDIIK